MANESQQVRWLFLDLNSYFASVEQDLRPELRGKPVAVVPVMADTTCCIAASYEAKACGVKTGTVVAEAKKRCPQLQIIEARHGVYVNYHHKIMTAVESCIPIAAVVSIDEVACQLTGRQQRLDHAINLANAIKQAIRDQAGATLRCSIGLAPNRFLAKIASDMHKPDGLTIITPSDLPEILYKLALIDFPGIGYRMEARLKKAGIRTSVQLLNLNKSQMRTMWGGVVGERFWHLLRGDDLQEFETHRRSVGHSHVLPPEKRTPELAYAVAQKLVHKAATRLRRMNYWAARFSLVVRFVDDPSWDANMQLIECQDTLTLLEALQSLWQKIPAGKPLAVGVALSDLIPDSLHNFSLFDESKRNRLAQAMDKLNTKYGSDTVHFGGLNLTKSDAPTRIAFTCIPDLDDLS